MAAPSKERFSTLSPYLIFLGYRLNNRWPAILSLRVNRLTIQNLRNISNADITLSPTLNFFHGFNGAGKTTILEAVYLLARAKSFRKGHPSTQLRRGAHDLTLFSEVEKSSSERIRVGLQRSGNKVQMRLNSEPIRKLSDLALSLPVALVTPQTHRILEEGPEFRRKLLNWGLFHVEHRYGQLLSSYNRVLLQRNHLLRSRVGGLDVWDRQLVLLANEIANLQIDYVSAWNRHARKLASHISVFSSLELSLHRGWERDIPLEDVLQGRVESDRKQGYTSVGSHRADIQVRIEGILARNYLSQGQQKLLIILLMFAQSLYMMEELGESPVFLMDDLQSELDPESQECVLYSLKTNPLQCLMTGIDPSRLVMSGIISDTRMFHVEQGSLTDWKYNYCLNLVEPSTGQGIMAASLPWILHP